MNVSENLHGFRVTRKRELSGLGVLYEMVYEKNGAELVYFDRDDTNKTFAIGFKTLPSDDTGVFHIIEHSVLCGSEKYPVKEPFVELLKGSLNTFLNAMTFDDKTVYPVASRNDKDFINLINVYMDAVLHPRILTMPEIFYQEGWHYELFDKESEPIYKGVVYNEMKGAYSSPDQLVYRYIVSLLYPDNCYRHDSGGSPEKIPELTYEAFVAAHARYYHPSNARIFLDGKMNLDEVLSLLDSFLSPYERLAIDTDIPMQGPTGRIERTVEYEIGEGESGEGKTRIALANIVSRFDECEKTVAISAIADVLAGSNESPLKKALLERGLCEDVSVVLYDGVMQNSLIIEVKNTSEDKKAEIESAVREVLSEAAAGIDKDRLRATLDFAEFNAREADFGSMPKGLVCALLSYETWLYGGDPADNIDRAKIYESLKARLDTGYFEDLVRECLLENENLAVLTLKPSSELGAERREREAAELRAAKAEWNDGELSEIIALNERLKLWQNTPDTKEQLATIPMLTLDDISDTPEPLPVEAFDVLGTKLLVHERDTSGIVYTELFFDLSGLSERELALASLLSRVLTNLPTENSGVIALQNKIKASLGAFSVGTEAVYNAKTKKATPYLTVSASALFEKRERIAEISREVLLATKYAEPKLLSDLVKQIKMATEMGFSSAGHALAMTRSAAKTSEAAAITERFSGYEFYLEIKKISEKLDTDAASLWGELEALAKEIFRRERIALLSETGKRDEDLARAIIEPIPAAGGAICEKKISLIKGESEGLAVPAQVAFASIACSLDRIGEESRGSLAVVRNILSFSHLWNAVRVQGGAYGAGMVNNALGNVGFYSYRDPSAKNSLSAFAASGDFLRSFVEGGEDLTKFIIGAVGDSDPLLTPRTAGMSAVSLYLRGITEDERRARRRELINTWREELLAAADTVDAVCREGYATVIGGKDKLLECGDKLDTILDVI